MGCPVDLEGLRRESGQDQGEAGSLETDEEYVAKKGSTATIDSMSMTSSTCVAHGGSCQIEQDSGGQRQGGLLHRAPVNDGYFYRFARWLRKLGCKVSRLTRFHSQKGVVRATQPLRLLVLQSRSNA